MKARKHCQVGSTLIIAVILTLVVTTAVGVGVLWSTQENQMAQRTKQFEGAQAVADGYIDWAFSQWRATCKLASNTAQPTSAFTITAPTGLNYPAGFTATNYSVQATDALLNAQASTSTAPSAVSFQNSGDTSWFYLASVTVAAPTISGKSVSTTVQRVLEKHLSSPWEYAIFYNDDLEFHPSPTFVVNGKVKTNGFLYTCPDGGNSLTFAQSVYYATGYSDGYAPGDYAWRGKAQAGAANTFASGVTPTQQTRSDPFGISPSDLTGTNPNNQGYRELLQQATAGYTDPFQNADGTNSRFYNNSGVRVLVDASNNVTIQDSTGATVASTSKLAKAILPAISTGDTITDNREAATVRLVTVDVSQINTAKTPGWNGVLYVSDTSAGQTGGSPKRGVRVKNGANIPTGGLTVVTDNPLYVQGDFNTGSSPQPAALVGDAINVLSNAWQDANSSLPVASRNATNTTVNAAFMGGIVPTVSTYNTNEDYSGGVENFPRFLENWSGQTFTYKGSMVEMFNSAQAIGRWSSASYNPPARSWSFDTGFLTNPPPGSLYTTTYVKQRWSTK